MAATNRKARERFAANIERLIEERGLSLDALAARAELGRDEIEEILRGEVEARASAIYRLAGVLGVDPGEFFAGIEWIPDGRGGGVYRVEDSPG